MVVPYYMHTLLLCIWDIQYMYRRGTHMSMFMSNSACPIHLWGTILLQLPYKCTYDHHWNLGSHELTNVIVKLVSLKNLISVPTVNQWLLLKSNWTTRCKWMYNYVRSSVWQLKFWSYLHWIFMKWTTEYCIRQNPWPCYISWKRYVCWKI